MTTKEQEKENFYRHSTEIVDETQESCLHLLEFYLTKENITLQRFIEINAHVIYHMCYNRYPCCQCPSYIRSETKGSRVLRQQQMYILFDQGGKKLPVHNPTSKSVPHCCSPVNPHLELHDLDFTLIILLLVSFTSIVPNGSVERNALDNLVKIRNESFAHAKEGRIPNNEYKKSMAEIKASLLVLAKVYGKETETTQRLSDIAKQPFNLSICLQLQNTLLQQHNTLQLLEQQNELLQQSQIDETIKQLLEGNKLPDCLTTDLCDVTVTEGCDAHFEIRTKEYVMCSLWFQDGVKIARSEKFIVGASGKIHSLDIKNALLSDKGLYTVKIQKIERQAHLYVEEYFTQNMDKTTECTVGENVELSCTVLKENFPAVWKKDELIVQQSGKFKTVDLGKIHKLSIISADLHDAGMYSVIVNNRVRSSLLKVKGTQDSTFKQKCHVCDKEPSVYWCHDCQRYMCQNCHDCINRHRWESEQEHVVQHVQDMYSMNSDFSIHLKEIIDIKVLHNEVLVIADKDGKQLVTCGITGQQQHTTPLPGGPYCIAVVNSNTVAVTVDTSVVTVDVKQRHVTQCIDVKVECFGIMYRDNQLFVGCDDGTIKIMEMSLEVTRTIPVGVTPRYICGWEAGRIYYTDYDKLYCIDTIGNTLFTFTDPKMDEPWGITTDDEGHVLVISRQSNNVLRISPDGKQSQVIITQFLSSHYPAMCYNSMSESVVIGRYNNVYVYQKI